MSHKKKREKLADAAETSKLGPEPSVHCAEDEVPYPEEQHSIYLEERKALHAAEEAYAGRFDKWMVTLSGGALAVSMTFVKDLVRPHQPLAVWTLFVAWVAFGVVIILSLWCTLLCQKVREQFGDDLDAAFREAGPDPLARAAELQGRRCLPMLIPWLNRGSLALFLMGVILLGAFISQNLADMGEQNGNQQSTQTAVR